MRSWGWAILLAGCQSAASSGASCARTSECAEPLVCAGGACRQECGDSRDCSSSASCVVYRGSGVCVPPSTPVPCLFNTDCGALFCRSGHCVAQCMSDHDCETGTCMIGDGGAGLCSMPRLTPPVPVDGGADGGALACASGLNLCVDSDGSMSCTDLMTDAHHCGGCGVQCPANERCASGVCVCPLSTCGSQCEDLQHDPSNCGGCGTGCAMGATCNEGRCCPAGQLSCGGSCVDETVSPNCGGCGVACMSGWMCRRGGCRPPGDACDSPLDVVVQDGSMDLMLEPGYVDDFACQAVGSADAFIALHAPAPAITVVMGDGTMWTELVAGCAASAECGNDWLGVIDTTPRLFELEIATGPRPPPRIESVPLRSLASIATGAPPFTTSITGPFMAWTDAPSCAPAPAAAAAYWYDSAAVATGVGRAVHACDPSGHAVTLAVRRGAGAPMCGVPDPSCPGGLSIALPGPGPEDYTQQFVVAFVGHASASDTGPITLSTTTL